MLPKLPDFPTTIYFPLEVFKNLKSKKLSKLNHSINPQSRRGDDRETRIRHIDKPVTASTSTMPIATLFRV